MGFGKIKRHLGTKIRDGQSRILEEKRKQELKDKEVKKSRRLEKLLEAIGRSKILEEQNREQLEEQNREQLEEQNREQLEESTVNKSIKSWIDENVTLSDTLALNLTIGTPKLLEYLRKYKSNCEPGTSEMNNLEMMCEILDENNRYLSDVDRIVIKYVTNATNNEIDKMIEVCKICNKKIFRKALISQAKIKKYTILVREWVDCLRSNEEDYRIEEEALEGLDQLDKQEMITVSNWLQTEQFLFYRHNELKFSLFVNLVRAIVDSYNSVERAYAYYLDKKTYLENEGFIAQVNNMKFEMLKIKIQNPDVEERVEDLAIVTMHDVLREEEEMSENIAAIYSLTLWSRRKWLHSEICEKMKFVKVSERTRKWVEHIFDIIYRTAGVPLGAYERARGLL